MNVKIHTADLLELHILEIFGLEYASEPCMRGWGREKYRPPQCLSAYKCPSIT